MKVIYTIFSILLLSAACTTGPDPETPLQTRILEVRVEPNPVAAGDTATFTCIISDSLDERFEYKWFLEADSVLLYTPTKENFIKWKAPDSSATYNHSVEVDNSSPDAQAPSKSISITVTTQNNQK